METRSLEGINFEFAPGTWFSVAGHTGSGKSTLAQHLNGLLLPMAGDVIVDGLEFREKSPALREIRKKVGLVFQYPEQQLFAETVFDEIAFAPRNWEVPEGEVKVRVQSALGHVGLDEAYLTRSPFHLSGGEKRKVAIASVLAASPDYLVLDEPTAGLDSFSRRELIRLLSRLKDEGVGILLVTHDLDAALQMSDQILILDRGRQVTCDTPGEVLSSLESVPVPGLRLPEIAALSALLRKRGRDVPLTLDWREIEGSLWSVKNEVF